MELNLIDCTEVHKKKKEVVELHVPLPVSWQGKTKEELMLAFAQDQDRVVWGPVRGGVNVVELQILHNSWRQFHFVVGLWGIKNANKSMMRVQSCCFAHLKLLLFCRSCCGRSRLCLISSLISWLWTVNKMLINNKSNLLGKPSRDRTSAPLNGDHRLT